jgi:hypothetical protein
MRRFFFRNGAALGLPRVLDCRIPFLFEQFDANQEETSHDQSAGQPDGPCPPGNATFPSRHCDLTGIVRAGCPRNKERRRKNS